jgi:2-iminobutanoate/2-iminopropanoate deaminase
MAPTDKLRIQTAAAPEAIGPYSQAIACGNLLFTSGQIALDPLTGALVEGGIEAETDQVMRNLEAVLSAAGARLGDVLKTTIFLIDMGDFAAVNRIYGSALGATLAPPARSTVQVSQLPRGARVEIEAVALLRNV